MKINHMINDKINEHNNTLYNKDIEINSLYNRNNINKYRNNRNNSFNDKKIYKIGINEIILLKFWNKFFKYILNMFKCLTKMQYFTFINIYIIIRLILSVSTAITSNAITIKIKGSGRQQIFNLEFSRPPTTIYFQDQELIINNNEIDIPGTESENEIILVWESQITNCMNMFKDLINIIEVDLSNFSPSYCLSMRNMFTKDINLISINMNNFDTSNCNDMNNMFSSCISLESLDLSNFDTTQVTNMDSMFFNCSSLITLVLSNFNTSLVTTMYNMFGNCVSLSSLNID